MSIFGHPLGQSAIDRISLILSFLAEPESKSMNKVTVFRGLGSFVVEQRVHSHYHIACCNCLRPSVSTGQWYVYVEQSTSISWLKTHPEPVLLHQPYVSYPNSFLLLMFRFFIVDFMYTVFRKKHPLTFSFISP